MTKEQFLECARWWYEDRLLIGGYKCAAMAPKTDDFSRYSRREDPPAMPDAVWLDGHYGIGKYPTAYKSESECSGEPIRYVRADREFCGSGLEMCALHFGIGQWQRCGSDTLYRFRP